MEYAERLEKFLGNVPKEKFRIYANKLLNECFIPKNCPSAKNCYYFIQKEKDLFTSYFDLLGYDITVSEEYGVIALNNTFGTGRITLRTIESIVLLILRLLFVEKKKELSQTDEVIVLVDEIYDRYRGLNGKRLNRTDIKKILGLFIIGNLDSSLEDPETRIIIYPSVILSLDTTELNKVYEMTKDKLDSYAKGGEDENDADDEEDSDRS